MPVSRPLVKDVWKGWVWRYHRCNQCEYNTEFRRVYQPFASNQFIIPQLRLLYCFIHVSLMSITKFGKSPLTLMTGDKYLSSFGAQQTFSFPT